MSNQSNSVQIGITDYLGILFVGLKLTGYIDWSWWYVTLPFYLPLLVIGIIALGVFGYQLLFGK